MKNNLKTATRTVIIDGQEIPMRISGATVIYYRQEFRKDFFAQMSKLNNNEINFDENGNPVSMTIPEDSVETILEMGYVMAKQGNPKMKESYIEWLDGFSFEAITESALAEITSMIFGDQQTIEEPKKNNEEPNEE